MQIARYGCTALAGTNKAGIMRPDEDGYYTFLVGALNINNSAGARYLHDQAAKDIFESSSSFMRRVQNGSCRAEWGHPKRTPGMSNRDFIGRVLQIYEDNVCAHFKEVWLEPTNDGSGVIRIYAKVKPMGPKGKYLQDAIDDPNQDVCFSIRSLTDDTVVNGRVHKSLRTVVNFDFVNEPGIHLAKKWNSPSLESVDELLITDAMLASMERKRIECGIGLENGTVSLEEIRNAYGWDKQVDQPASMAW